jgi:hypothetical protein
MPIKWTPELDTVVRPHPILSFPSTLTRTQLLHGVFEECNISFSKALCQKLAERVKTGGIGTSITPLPPQSSPSFTDQQPDCTAKAVENRLYSWKKKNVGSGDATPKAAGTPKAATAPKTPKSRAKKQKVASESDEPEGLQGEDEAASPLAGRKRQRATPKKNVDYKETDGEDDSDEKEYIPFQGWKRVKKEPVEEERVAFGEDVQASVEEV